MSIEPIRIQLRRTKGWRMPENTVRCARPGKWGNKFAIGHHYKRGGGGIPRMGIQFVFTEAYEGYQDSTYTTIKTNAEAIEWYRWYLGTFSAEHLAGYLCDLRGKNLACWCKPGDECHVDVLLELANA